MIFTTKLNFKLRRQNCFVILGGKPAVLVLVDLMVLLVLVDLLSPEPSQTKLALFLFSLFLGPVLQTSAAVICPGHISGSCGTGSE